MIDTERYSKEDYDNLHGEFKYLFSELEKLQIKSLETYLIVKSLLYILGRLEVVSNRINLYGQK